MCYNRPSKCKQCFDVDSSELIESTNDGSEEWTEHTWHLVGVLEELIREVDLQHAEIREQHAEIREQHAEIREQHAEIREQHAEIREQHAKMDTLIQELKDSQVALASSMYIMQREGALLQECLM